MRRVFGAILIAIALFAAAGCTNEADRVSHNISEEADKFKIFRQIVYINGITDSYILTIQGYCALGNYDGALERTVTCREENGEYKKYFLGRSDNTILFTQQLDTVNVSDTNSTVRLRPKTVLPNFDGETDYTEQDNQEIPREEGVIEQEG